MGHRTWDTKRALELYNKGLSDDRIGEAVGVSSHAIAAWRNSCGLPIHARVRWSRKQAQELIDEGYTNKEIAEALGTTVTAITCWRVAGAGNPNGSHHRWDTEKAHQLYEAGCTDKQIAEAIGIKTKSFGDWRRRKGLPANRAAPSGPTRKWDISKAQILYDEGKSDAEIAALLNTTPAAVSSWRRECGYIKGINRRSWDTEKARVLFDAGATDQKIAEEVGATRAAVRSWRRINNMRRK